MTPASTALPWLLPDGVPNAHPMLVHFPIGLLITAFLCDCVALALKRRSSWRNGATALYAFGTALMVATYLTGREAAALVFTPGMAHALVDEHWTWAMWTLIYFSSLTVGRIAAHQRLLGDRSALRSLFVLAGLGGVALLTATSERGARLVYEYGVGVIIPGSFSP